MENTLFSALEVFEDSHHCFQRQIRQKAVAELPPGDVLIQVRYSSLNYKDALSASGNRGVTKSIRTLLVSMRPVVVVQSVDPIWQVGDEVICTGYDLGMNTSGGYGQYIRVPGAWIVRKPSELTLLESMQLGTAGFTAAQCLLQLEHNSITPDKGPILVTGATGGVGTMAHPAYCINWI